VIYENSTTIETITPLYPSSNDLSSSLSYAWKIKEC